MKILLTGANGFVGRRIFETYKEITVPSPSLRNMTEDQVRRVVEESGADVIIHTAAISGIPQCQADPEASYYANVMIPVFLAKAAQGRKLICFSSDQVYSGSDKTGPFVEGDEVPSNIYSVHKLEMEHQVLDICPEAVMLRAEWMYDNGSEKDTFYTIVRDAKEPLSFSSQQYRGVTWRKEVADSMLQVMKLPGGAYNFGSETDLSMGELTREFAAYLGKDIAVTECDYRQNLWMDCSKAKKLGVCFSSVLDGLKKCAEEDRSGRLN